MANDSRDSQLPKSKSVAIIDFTGKRLTAGAFPKPGSGCNQQHGPKNNIETGWNPVRKGSFYYDELFTNRKGTVRAGSNLPGWSIYQADGGKLIQTINSVSYTHLDVYKRQVRCMSCHTAQAIICLKAAGPSLRMFRQFHCLRWNILGSVLIA